MYNMRIIMGKEESLNFSQDSTIELPTSTSELIHSCIHRVKVGDNMQLSPGLLMEDAPDDENDIWGMYGIEYIDPKTERATVRTGFTILGSILDITHTPQGLMPQTLIRQERRRLMVSNFRYEMVKKTIDIAASLNLSYLTGTVSSNHSKVTEGIISPEEGRRFIDTPFEFEYYGRHFDIHEGRYYMNLHDLNR